MAEIFFSSCCLEGISSCQTLSSCRTVTWFSWFNPCVWRLIIFTKRDALFCYKIN